MNQIYSIEDCRKQLDRAKYYRTNLEAARYELYDTQAARWQQRLDAARLRYIADWYIMLASRVTGDQALRLRYGTKNTNLASALDIRLRRDIYSMHSRWIVENTEADDYCYDNDMYDERHEASYRGV